MSTAKMVINTINEMPEGYIIKLIKDTLDEHEVINTKKTKEDLICSCATLLLKDQIKIKGVNKCIEEFENISGLHSFFSNKN